MAPHADHNTPVCRMCGRPTQAGSRGRIKAFCTPGCERAWRSQELMDNTLAADFRPAGPLCPKGHVKTGSARPRKLANGEVRMHPECLICRREKKKAYVRRNPEKARRSAWRTNLRRKYGIEAEDFDTLSSLQEGVCAICGGPPRGKPLHVDHDHRTGRVRGLLCYRCNLAVGQLDDSPERAERLAQYIRGDGFTRLIPGGRRCD